MNACKLLKKLKINIDDGANGVWLPSKANPAETEAISHLGGGLHTNVSREVIFMRLMQAFLRGGGNGNIPGATAEVRATLEVIRRELASGKLLPF